MGRQKTSGRPGAKGKQPSLLSGGFDFNKYPMLKKPMEVIGETPSTCRAHGQLLGQVSCRGQGQALQLRARLHSQFTTTLNTHKYTFSHV